MIAGVQLIPLQQFPDQRGVVYHMLRVTDPHFRGFGEIYFSSVYPGVVKAWKNHRRATVHYACVSGRLKMVLYDARPGSASHGEVMEITMSPDDYRLVIVPPGVWNGFQGLSEPQALLANCSTEPFDPAEFERLDPQAKEIPYQW